MLATCFAIRASRLDLPAPVEASIARCLWAARFRFTWTRTEGDLRSAPTGTHSSPGPPNAADRSDSEALLTGDPGIGGREGIITLFDLSSSSSPITLTWDT